MSKYTVPTWYWTVSCMAPRWTGMWGALDTSPPSGPNTAQEKSRRSLMLVEIEVLWRTLPICSVEKPQIQTLRRSCLCFVLRTLQEPAVYLLCSWSDERRWRAERCWAQCRGHTDGPSPQSRKRRPLLFGRPHSMAPPGWCWSRKDRIIWFSGEALSLLFCLFN